MGFTLIDYFNGFQSLKNSRHFSAGVQATYYAILAEFNKQRYPEQLELSTRDLQRLAGLKSVSSTHEARNVLKNNKLIDFHTQNNTTVYQLCAEHLQTTSRTPAEHLPNSCRTLSYSNSLPSSPLKEKENKTLTDIQSRARIESGIILNNKREGTEKEESDSIDSLIEYWEQAGGSKLNFIIISELKALLETNSLALLKKAVKEASLGNNSTEYGFSLNYFKLKLSEIQKAVPAMKGGESSGRYQRFEEPDTSWIKSYS